MRMRWEWRKVCESSLKVVMKNDVDFVDVSLL